MSDTHSGGHRLFDTGRKCARCPGRMVVSHQNFFFLSSYVEECERCGWISGETPKDFRRRRISTFIIGATIFLVLFYFTLRAMGGLV